ncbi:uncharacterized protein LOC117650045 [Thrips palmi]|uniref:Uncharacterized protein LOC117650045 n=1 Tax=Thrips palmi TaxID=161013 RepID=A0A6P8ZWJ6_THRPL|nr:uncharacterized protein LOC117650045 [Thrips palmi]
MITELGTIVLSDLSDGKMDAMTTEATVTPAKKRQAEEMGSEGITPRESWSEERVRRAAKKFRVEWMNETYFRDWLRPHPTDETYCICIACDIKLRCGKSELEKHASGMKHCRKMDLMKENPNNRPQLTAILPEGSLSQAAERVLCEENGTFFVTAGEDFDATALNSVEAVTATSTTDAILSKALIKLSKYLDGKSDADKRKIQMAETEHHRRMQVLNKELELRSIEVLIRQAELQKLNNCAPVQGKHSNSKASSVRDDICDDEEEEDVGL